MASKNASTKSKPAMAGQHEFPALFTIDGSSRHEIILVNPGHDLHELKESMESLVSSSPNCAEALSKYKSKDTVESVGEIKIKWSSEGRDMQLFPKETVLTEDNCEPVLRMMAIGVGRDVLDITMEKKKNASADAKEGAPKKLSEGPKKLGDGPKKLGEGPKKLAEGAKKTATEATKK